MKQYVVCAAVVLTVLCQAAAAYSQTTGGMDAKIGTLGIGFDGAVAVSERSNVRVGVNFFNYNHDFDNDGITLAAQLKLRSVVTQLDWFPTGGGFHVSPGLMIYNGNRVEAKALVPGGQTFELGNNQFLSSASSPVSGDAKVSFEKVAPMVTIGWGNVAPRGDRRWSIPVELGAVFSRSPVAALNLGGNACLANGSNCRNVATDPALQADVRAQEANLNSDIEMLKIIPVFSVGFGYRF